LPERITASSAEEALVVPECIEGVPSYKTETELAHIAERHRIAGQVFTR
jgi:hypothetical protein